MCEACPQETSDATGWTAGIITGVLVALTIFVGLDLRFGWTQAAGGNRLKPAINAVQGMTVLLMFPVEWPSMMIELGKVFEGFSVDVSVLSPSCLGIPFGFYERFVWSSTLAFAFVIGPFLVGGVVALIRAGFHRRCGCWKKERALHGRETTRTFGARFILAWRAAFRIAAVYSMVVVLFVHPAISGQAFFFFRCHEIKDVEKTLTGGGNSNAAKAQSLVTTVTSYLVADYALKCFDGAWFTMLPWAIFVVVGFSLGVPTFLLCNLCKHRKAIKEIGRQAIIDAAAKKEKERVEKSSLGRRAATRLSVGLSALAKRASTVRTRVRALSRTRASSVTVTVDDGKTSDDGDVGDRRMGWESKGEACTEGKDADGGNGDRAAESNVSWEGVNPMHRRCSSLEQTAPDLGSQMTGAGSRRHWHRVDGCADRRANGGKANKGAESKTVNTVVESKVGDAEWYFISHEAETSQRLVTDEAPAMYEAGELSATTLVWAKGFTDGWLPLHETILFVTCSGSREKNGIGGGVESKMYSNPMLAVATAAADTAASIILNSTGETKSDHVIDEEEVKMHSNPMNATATPIAGTRTEGTETETAVERGDKEENRAAIRLGVLYSIYKPECFYFDIINIFHVS
jgi:hypothetical protein